MRAAYFYAIIDVVAKLMMCSILQCVQLYRTKTVHIQAARSKHKKTINPAHRILKITVIRVKQLQPQCAPLKTYAHSCCRLHNTHHDTESCYVKCTAVN
jgi:hypothetical protein